MSYDMTTSSYIPTVTPISVVELQHLNVKLNGSEISYSTEFGIPVFEVPCINIEDVSQVEVNAAYSMQASGFDSSFDSSFVGDNKDNLYFYKNTFEVYGYDLGNSALATGNPDFNIYFVIDDNDWDQSFGPSFYRPGQYADAIYIRKPFTDQVYLYDNTTATGDITWNVNNHIISTRNGRIDSEESVTFEVTKTRYRYTTTTTSTNSVITVDANRYIYEQHSQEFTSDPFPLIVKLSTHTNHPVKNEKSDTIVFIDYNQAIFNKDDIEVNPYDFDRLNIGVYTYAGIQLAFHTVDFSPEDYNPYDNVLEFYPPEEGDYLVIADLLSYNYSGDLIRSCKVQSEIHVDNWLEITDLKCNGTLIDNKSFEESTINQYILEDNFGKFSFKLVNTITVPRLESLTIIPSKDGIYKYEISNPEHDPAIIVQPYHCNILMCFKEVQDQIIAQPLCDFEGKNFTQFNAIMAVFLKYLERLQGHYIDNPYLDPLTADQLNDLYTTQQLFGKLEEYCYNCENLNFIDCDCPTN